MLTNPLTLTVKLNFGAVWGGMTEGCFRVFTSCEVSVSLSFSLSHTTKSRGSASSFPHPPCSVAMETCERVSHSGPKVETTAHLTWTPQILSVNFSFSMSKPIDLFTSAPHVAWIYHSLDVATSGSLSLTLTDCF